ncbi:MAG: DNA-binding transcriptional ArsR family regulator [Halobacteriales archaeon]|jgi:DNA-binding transcriptional ArsR family regulator
MSRSTERLRRYLEEELEECRAEDVDGRLAELERLQNVADANRVEEHVAVLSGLANETRYRLVRALVAADGELCVCELHPLVDVSESAVSHAMSSLVDAGLATRRKDGKWRKYESSALAERLVGALGGGDAA